MIMWALIVMLASLAQIGALVAGDRLTGWEQCIWVGLVFVQTGIAWIWQRIAK